MKEAIYIPKSLIRQAARDNEFLDVLALCLMIKVSHANSMLLNFSLRKIMSLCGCNGKRAKELWIEACRTDMVYMVSQKHVIARSFRTKEKQSCIRFSVRRDVDGNRRVFLESNETRNNETGKQTISEIRNIILTAALLDGIRGYNHTINTCIKSASYKDTERHYDSVRSGVWNKNYDTESSKGDTAANPLKRGYSYDAILRNVYNNSISKYKLTTLVKKAVECGLLKTWENKYVLMEVSMDDGEPLNIYDFFVTIDHKTGKKKNQYKKSITPKQCKGCIKYYHHLANGYQLTSSVSCNKKNWNLINSGSKGE